jgi:MFS family permease
VTDTADRFRDCRAGTATGSLGYVYLLTCVAALGGLLFGYDTAVISGAIGFLQSYFGLDPQLWKGWAAASALIGCAFGAAFAGMASDRLGRKKVLILSAVLFLISALGTALPRSFTEFILYRIIGGLGVGAASMTSPMYIAEISPARMRGRMVSVNQFAIVTGMLVVYFVNFFIGGYGAAVDRAAIEPRIARQGTTVDPDRAAAFLRKRAKLSARVDANDPASMAEFESRVAEFLATAPKPLEAGAVIEFLKRYEVNVDETGVLLADQGEVPWNVARGWRWMFGSEALPATLLLLLLFFVPESPRWLTKQGRCDRALGVLTRVDGPENARVELAAIEEAIAQETGSIAQLFLPGLRIVLVIGVVLAVLQQITGINVFLYYAPEIFKKMGTGASAALLQTVVVGAVNLSFTIIAIWTVDRLGRKPLMLVGYSGMAVSLVALGLAAYWQTTAVWVLAFILGYIACFALSVGPVTWVILSEIFPTRIRGRAMAIATVCLWLANFVVTQTFTIMDESPGLVARFHHGFPFWVYAGFCVVAVAFLLAFVSETKGKTLEEIERGWMR